MVLLLAWISTAGAESIIWKCKEPKGGVVYQNSPCAPGTAQGAKAYDTPDRPEALAERARHEAEMDRRNAAMHADTGYGDRPNSQTPRDLQKQQCQYARQAANEAARNGVPYPVRERYERAAVDACFGL
ncbi:MAG: DUF4124 domain-containing protein [Lysobacteraceae bacterium]